MQLQNVTQKYGQNRQGEINMRLKNRFKGDKNLNAKTRLANIRNKVEYIGVKQDKTIL